MANKDFLSQFSTNNKPDSFKEEERVKIDKPKKSLDPKFIIIGGGIVLVAAVVLIIIFVLPHIPVQDFTGLAKEDATAWLKQQGIETQGIIFKEEYNFDLDKGLIISQEPNDGKVKKNAKITFVVSGGADPEEKITVPDLKSMNKDEILAWIKENKLTSTKLNTTYDTTIPEGEFIKADYSGCSEDSFTRGCSLKISVSKGPKPADEITMADFVKKTFVEFESWANGKGIKLNKTEVFSDTYESGIVIAQSVKENEKVKTGDTVEVSVSKGKGIKVPDFSKMSEKEIDDWSSENSAYVKVIKKHFNSNDLIISQTKKTGAYISHDDKLELTMNLGDHFYLDELNFTIIGGSYDKFKDESYKWVENLGIYIDTHKVYVDSDKPEGTIIDYKEIKAGKSEYSEVQRLPLDVDITVTVSNGNGIQEDEQLFLFPVSTFCGPAVDKTYNDLINWNIDNSTYGMKIVVVEGGDDDKQVEYAKKITEIVCEDVSSTALAGDFYIPYGATIKIKLEPNS